MKRWQQSIAITLMAAMIIVAGSCASKSADPGQWQDIPPSGWLYEKKLVFQLAPDSDYAYTPSPGCDTITPHQPQAGASEIEISLRHADAYPYSNLWLSLTYPTGDTTCTDTVQIELADAYGKWHGTGVGPSYQISRPITTNHRINDAPRIKVHHIMRVDTLTGIEQIGLKMLHR